MSAQQNKRVVRRLICELLSHTDLALADQIVAPGYVEHDPLLGEWAGPEGLKRLSRSLRAAFPDGHWTINGQFAARDRVVTRWAFRGTQFGAFAGIPASGAGVWHVYVDLGDCGLERKLVDPVALRSGIEVVARLHGGFANHPLLGDCQATGGSLGRDFFLSSVRDALRALGGLRPPRAALPQEHRATRDRLRERLMRLLDEAPRRLEALEELDGRDTLLHGDLWPSNLLVVEKGEVRLIDWDHAGVGPATYDLSNMLMRLPVDLRLGALADYREAGGVAGRGNPGRDDLNYLFETAEYTRLANCVIWPALEFWERRGPWALERLAAIDGWFEQLEPALPAEPALLAEPTHAVSVQ